MAKPILPDPIQPIDQSTNQVQFKKAKLLANRVANFWQDNLKLFPHTYFSDFTKEQCLAAGRCSVRGAV